jgi:hypothetical protein
VTAPLPVIVVAGLGRCGTTLVMHMLARGGVAVAGEAPGYEPEESGPGHTIDPAWFRRFAGGAVKVIDPHRNRVPQGVPFFAFWLDREPMQQARSQEKFYRFFEGDPALGQDEMRRWALRLRSERREALSALQHAKGGCFLRFESLIMHPTRAARALGLELERQGIAADVDAMAKVPRLRSTACAPGLAIEAELAAEADALRLLPS